MRIGTANLVVVRLGNWRRDISQGVTFVTFLEPTVLAKTVGLFPRPNNTYLKD